MTHTAIAWMSRLGAWLLGVSSVCAIAQNKGIAVHRPRRSATTPARARGSQAGEEEVS